MATVQVLSESEQEQLREDLREYSSLETEGDLTSYLTEENMSDGEVEIRFFATPETGPVEGIYFEVAVNDTAPWKVDSVGSYGSENLRSAADGSPHYQALAEELESLVEDVVGTRPDFVVTKGGEAFTAEVSV